jgi:hypothetical protein
MRTPGTVRMTDAPAYTIRDLGPGTWDDFAALVEANNGVWGGCWCMGFHPEGLDRETPPPTATPSGPTSSGEPSTRCSSTRTTPAWAGASTGPRLSCPTSRTPRPTPRTSAACRTGGSAASSPTSRTEGQGVARAAVAAALAAIKEAGGGIVEAYPEQVEGRPPQRGSYLHTGPETLFEELGFARDRQIAKWRWVMRLTVAA